MSTINERSEIDAILDAILFEIPNHEVLDLLFPESSRSCWEKVQFGFFRPGDRDPIEPLGYYFDARDRQLPALTKRLQGLRLDGLEIRLYRIGGAK